MTRYETQQIAIAELVLDTHTAKMGLEEGLGGEVDLWHLIVSLLTWCDAKGVDFDATVSDVRADLAADRAYRRRRP